MRARLLASLAWALAAAFAAGCAGLPLAGEPAPLRISEVAGAGDAARRASTRLVLDGLTDDADGQLDAAQAAYERALRVDPTNPWAYLALARHHAEGIEPSGAIAYLERTEALLDAEGGVPPRADAHLVGLRGAALSASGRGDEGSALLAEARRRAPSVWDDGRLAADELR